MNRPSASEVGTTIQPDEKVEVKDYIVDYLSDANRDIMLLVEGMYTETYRYDPWSQRVSVELDYALETSRGEPGENIGSDIATGDVEKVWYRRSHLSSTLYAVDASGDVAFHLQYDEWGNPETDTLARQNHAGIDNLNNFTGYTYDDVLGIYFAQNRFYDAEIMRFTQEDPVRSGMNWFAYVGNNPMNAVDPWGLETLDTYQNGNKTGTLTVYSNYIGGDFFEMTELVTLAGGTYTYNRFFNQKYTIKVNGYEMIIKSDDNSIEYGSVLSATAKKAGKTNITIKYRIEKIDWYRDTLYINIVDFNKLLDTDKKIHVMLPTSGSELNYEPSVWNDPNYADTYYLNIAEQNGYDHVQYRTNCYAYALNMKSHADGRAFINQRYQNWGKALKDAGAKAEYPFLGQYYETIMCLDNYKKIEQGYGLQPGMYSNSSELNEYIFKNKLSNTDLRYTKNVEKYYQLMLIDMNAIPNITAIEIGQYDVAPAGYYKVCLVVDDEDDYHWYRQNSDGTWSHKPGSTQVTDLDWDEKKIINPVTAHRKSGDLVYRVLVGFYAIKKN